MLSLGQKYKPVLSTPFGRGGYREIQPCAALAPFIRCLWEDSREKGRVLVIPDTCMDIIFETGGSGFFCAMDDAAFFSESSGRSMFGIRFYAWAARMFSRRDFSQSKGGRFELGEFFDGTEELSRAMLLSDSFEERAAAAEKWLLKQLDGVLPDNDLLNAAEFIVRNHGAVSVSGLCMHTAVSPRTMERLFLRNLGVSPKKFSSLVRYQLLWQDILRPGFDVSDAVGKYGYFDQAHLLNDFRRRHLMTPKQAVKYSVKLL